MRRRRWRRMEGDDGGGCIGELCLAFYDGSTGAVSVFEKQRLGECPKLCSCIRVVGGGRQMAYRMKLRLCRDSLFRNRCNQLRKDPFRLYRGTLRKYSKISDRRRGRLDREYYCVRWERGIDWAKKYEGKEAEKQSERNSIQFVNTHTHLPTLQRPNLYQQQQDNLLSFPQTPSLTLHSLYNVLDTAVLDKPSSHVLIHHPVLPRTSHNPHGLSRFRKVDAPKLHPPQPKLSAQDPRHRE